MLQVIESSRVVFAQEGLTDSLWDELMPLMEAHCAEVGPFKDLPFNPNKAAYQRMASYGALAVFTARNGERLVGYAAFFISPSLHHYPAIFAQADVIYLMPEQRQALAGLSFMQFIRAELADRDVNRAFIGSKADPSKSIAPLLDRIGAVLVDQIHVLEINHG
jgi:hypothetical protein